MRGHRAREPDIASCNPVIVDWYKGSRSNKLGNFAGRSALLRCPPLAVLALRRAVRLALHPATTAKLPNLLLREP